MRTARLLSYLSLATVAAPALCIANANAADQIVRYRNPAHMTEPWAREFAEVIEIPANAQQLVLSGVGPTVANASAPPDTAASYGDTATQTGNVLGQIERILKDRGYSMGDIVSMQALIVADPATGKPDFTGFSNVYNQYFGTDKQPNVPVRTRAEVLRLVPPGWLVEVTVTASRVPSRLAQ
ncbi:RidA family protein [Cupriavidus necator]|uniref:RidA family protein n=1 Tax=Cupriavidus necator TaxID=106590 RepID=UPI0027840AAC|nr:RidA family protein [Cupriavidus necator]MDQ0143220.1 enamine deaminase RidA (YjgF/YER057c/UK114 family) [Cupriavidus necator]